MGQLLVPALIGAGVGAVGGAAMGKNPFTTALLGAGLGAGGAGLLGAGVAGGAATGATGIQLAQAPLVEGFATSLAPTVVGGSGAAGITGLGTQALGGAGITGLGSLGGAGAGITGLSNMGIDSLSLADTSRLAYNTPLSFGEKLSNLGSSGYSYLKDNPTSALNGVNSLTSLSNQQDQSKQQKLNEAVQRGQVPAISKGNYTPSSSLINVSPNIDLMPSNKNGLLGMMARIPMTDEEKMKLQQLAQYGYRG
jgi:hypothetical protein